MLTIAPQHIVLNRVKNEVRWEWVSGTVLSCELDWVEADPLGGAPYSIRFDGEDTSLYLWGPRDSIREIQADANVNDVKTLRFDVGDRVESKYGA